MQRRAGTSAPATDDRYWRTTTLTRVVSTPPSRANTCQKPVERTGLALFPPRKRYLFGRVARRIVGDSMSRLGIVLTAALPRSRAASASRSAGQSGARSFSGLAAYYSGRGKRLYGKKHRTLPFGTRVRVTDPRTGRSVIVTINDRGPFGRGRVLDLCTPAARALGMIGRGVIYVRADVL